MLFGGRVVSNAALVVLSVVSARVLGPDGRGVVVIVMTLTMVTSLATSLGIPTALRVRLPRGDSPTLLASYLGLGIVAAAVQALVCTALAAIVLPHANYHPTFGHFVLVGALGTSMAAAYILMDAMLAMGDTPSASIADAGGSLVQLGVYIGWELYGETSVRSVLIALIVGYIVSVTWMVLVLVRRRMLAVRGRRDEWADLVRSGLAPLGQSLAHFSIYRADRLILGVLRPSRQVGLYSIGATCTELVRLLPLTAGQIMLHRIAGDRLPDRDVARVCAAVMAMAATGLGVVYIAAPTIIDVVFGDEYQTAVGVVRLLAVAELSMTGYQLASHVLLGRGLLRDAAAPAAVGALLVLGLDLALIPAHGATGAAWAAVFGYSLMAVEAVRRAARPSARPHATLAA